jgi:hypothetical protein
MACNLMKSTFDLAHCVGRLLLFAALVVPKSVGQAPESVSGAREVLRWPEEEQIAFVKTALERGLPEADGDRFSLLLVNRSGLVVPHIQTTVENELRRSPRSERLIDLASATITYAGDEESLRAVSKLIAIDEKRFESLVGRTLDSAVTWKNPFSVAYAGLQLDNDALSQRIVTWCETVLASDHMKRLWGSAMADKHGRVLTPLEWSNDPLASRLPKAVSDKLRDSVTRYATEASVNREEGKR